jgi:hypothetical protein
MPAATLSRNAGEGLVCAFNSIVIPEARRARKSLLFRLREPCYPESMVPRHDGSRIAQSLRLCLSGMTIFGRRMRLSVSTQAFPAALGTRLAWRPATPGAFA